MMPALARLLRPLVRLLTRCGVTFPVLAELLRGLYVEIALGDLPPADRARSDSRISLRTGVHRKLIRRLRHDPPPQPEQAPAVVTRSLEIIGRWLGMAPWMDAEGHPRPLPRSGPGDSFEALVASVTTDVRPRAVLDEWLAQGLVTLDGRAVRLNVGAFVPPPGQAAQLHFFARNLHDHIAAASANVVQAPPPFLERSVHYDRLPPAVAERLEALGRAGAQELLVRINRAALEMLGPDAPPAGPTRRVNLGIYLYVVDETEDAAR
jgi:hypothetical protein